MTEPGLGEGELDRVPVPRPDGDKDPIIDGLRTAAEFIGSPDRLERELARTALNDVGDLAVESKENGQRLARLLRVRVETEGSDLHRTDEEVRKSLERLDAHVGGGNDIFIDLDLEGYISLINNAIAKAAGYNPDDLLDMRFSQIVHRNDLRKVGKMLESTLRGENEPIEFRINSINGGIRWMSASPNILRNSEESAYGFSIRMHDITERVEAQQQLEAEKKELESAKQKLKELSEHDELTGLFNRRKATDEMTTLEGQGRRMRKFPVSILYIDVDDFKSINDGQSHHTVGGDEALREVASLLVSSMKNHVHAREDDDYIVSRWGGDEFLIILQKTNLEQAQEIVERIKITFENARSTVGVNPTVSVGVGVADNSDGVKNALLKADEELGEIQEVKRLERKARKLESQLKE
jgi:diguanylate cyclase (GGDEF)-like protein/PAS domain S-box-containing protein